MKVCKKSQPKSEKITLKDLEYGECFRVLGASSPLSVRMRVNNGYVVLETGEHYNPDNADSGAFAWHHPVIRVNGCFMEEE